MNTADSLAQPDYPFPVYSLFTWNEPNDHLTRRIIQGLKGGFATGAIGRLAEQLTFEREWSGDSELRFIHPPATNGGVDHAAALAAEVAALWGAKAVSLTWKTETARNTAGDPARAFSRLRRLGQKHRSAIERTERRFEDCGFGVGLDIGLDADLASFTPPSTTWIFVDDVITTGSTAMAAYMALGNPERFEAWTLACRPKLAGKQGV